MNGEKKRKKRWRIGLAIFLLGVVCLGGMELLFCWRADPALFERVTAPVRQAAKSAADRGGRLAEAAVNQGGELVENLSDLLAPPEPETPPDDQLVSEPEIEAIPGSADFTITELVEREEGRLTLTGGTAEITYYNQGEEPWASQPYGSNDIGHYGCGPAAMAMVVSSLTDTEVDPAEMARWAYENGCCVTNSGSALSIVPDAAAAYGLESAPLRDADPSALRRELLSGSLIVALMNKGHFTNSGHFIVLRGATLDGSILVADPNSTERSLALWDPQLILDELSASRSSGAPLWVLSPPLAL